jgi:tRNA threonylcarbamoyl adenosine modification protein YeaZ
MILAFETSTDVCSVAFQDSDGEIFEKRIQGRSVHSDNLFLFTQDLIKEHSFSIDQIKTALVSNGPGSYTGLRIAASAIKGIFFQTNVEVLAVNTLAGFAASQLNSIAGTVHAIIDARRTHVYHQSFEVTDHLISNSQMAIIELSEFETQLKTGQKLVGTGLQRIDQQKLLDVEVFDSESISAKNLIELYNAHSNSEFLEKTTLEELDPNYITSSQVNNSQKT